MTATHTQRLKKRPLSRLVITGYKSIRECDLHLSNLNLLLGPNGAGKSNVIHFLRFLQNLYNRQLQVYIGKSGGADAILHFGRKVTSALRADIYTLGDIRHSFTLEPTEDNRMVFTAEKLKLNFNNPNVVEMDLGSGHFESHAEMTDPDEKDEFVNFRTPPWCIYHFQDTGESSPIKQRHGINVNDYLRPDARNLAAFLHLLQRRHAKHYFYIVKTIQMVAPFFEDFHLRPCPDNQDQIELEWLEKGNSDPFKANILSDGTLRFICLAAALMQPPELRPEAIIIDEPEIGLHPRAVNLLASMLKAASVDTQIIVATQSADLVSEFEPKDVIVADRGMGSTQLKRLDEDKLKDWLEDYTLGELWKKNVLGGGPSR